MKCTTLISLVWEINVQMTYKNLFPLLHLATITIVNIDANEDEQLQVTSPGGATGLNLREDERMYFGGLPKAGRYRYGDVHVRIAPTFNIALCWMSFCLLRSEVVVKSYSGCMKDIEVSRTPYNLLSSPDYTGLIKGCSIEVRLQKTRCLPSSLLFSLFSGAQIKRFSFNLGQ